LQRALNLLRDEPHFRRQCFDEGLRAAGFEVVKRIDKPRPEDLCLTWNRQGSRDQEARRFERVLVAENAFVSVKGWYALARDHHAGLGRWPVGDPKRWASLGVELQPWRADEGEVVILGQRSMGEKHIASPRGWEELMQRRIGGRIRPHPTRYSQSIPLEDDLAKARCVVTWASSAALTALRLGIPAFYGLGGWIGASACRPVERFADGPLRDDAARLAMFERLAWAQSPISEIRSGEAMRRQLA
jgi:hypothetical protein